MEKKFEVIEAPPAQPIVLRGVVIDLATSRISRGRRTLKLTPAEAELLAMLLGRANRLVRTEDLVAALHAGVAFSSGRERLRFTIKRLKKKLGRAQHCLETVRGRGYVFRWVTDDD